MNDSVCNQFILKVIIYWMPVLFLFSAVNVLAIPKDTTSPTYFWIYPKELSILTTNNIRLSVKAHDNESGIKKVIFYARHGDNIKNIIQKYPIGEELSPPYEFLWDCSHIPDQYIGKLRFYCDVIDNAGNITSKPVNGEEEYGRYIVLDRISKKNEMKFFSHQTNKTITIDGVLNEWAPLDSIVFKNNDNKIVVYSVWNKRNIFFGVKVEDTSVISHGELLDKSKWGNLMEDRVEIFLDTNHDHYEVFTSPDICFSTFPKGIIFKEIQVHDELNHELTKDYNVNGKIDVKGTLNNENDIDSCYTIEIAVTWEELDIVPRNNLTMGFEVMNTDYDYIGGEFFSSHWSTPISNLQNPSEWGNIVFVKRHDRFKRATVFPFAILFVIVVFVFLSKKFIDSKKEVVNAIISKDDNTLDFIVSNHIKKAINYLEEHYFEEKLSRDDVARFIGLSSNYFSNLFKHDMDLHFVNYLNSLRVEKSKSLLLSTSKTVSEIAFEVGFCSQSYFARIFKHNEKISPTEYRKKNLKHT